MNIFDVVVSTTGLADWLPFFLVGLAIIVVGVLITTLSGGEDGGLGVGLGLMLTIAVSGIGAAIILGTNETELNNRLIAAIEDEGYSNVVLVSTGFVGADSDGEYIEGIYTRTSSTGTSNTYTVAVK
jgi:hypothetical protein